MAAVQPDLGKISVPYLLVNSHDDPVAVFDNSRQYTSDIAAHRHVLLAELTRDGHGTKGGVLGPAFGSDLAPTIIAEFVAMATVTVASTSNVPWSMGSVSPPEQATTVDRSTTTETTSCLIPSNVICTQAIQKLQYISLVD